MANKQPTCPIWETTVESVEDDFDKQTYIVVGSPRTGGDYEITVDAIHLGKVGNLAPAHKAKLTTFLIDSRQTNKQRPLVTYKLVEQATVAEPLPDSERAERLLRYLVKKSTFVGESFVTYDIVNDQKALAWSESTKVEEIASFLEHMATMGWLKYKLERDCTITVAGRQRVAEQLAKKDLSQCFVAMWIDDSMDSAYQDGIKKAVEDCGYEPLRIDKTHHLNKICDEAIAAIRRSGFVVADFTHDADGARGSVFYEAGFAHALDRPVIFTCRKDHEKRLHFDTRQYPHILWKNEEDLYTQLREKIGALVGDYKAEPAHAVSE